MNTSLDSGFAVMPRREPPSVTIAPSPAAAVTVAPPQTGPAAIPPAAATERSGRLATSQDREHAPLANDDAETAGATPRDAGSAPNVTDQNRFTYDREYNRVFIDVVDASGDQVVMRIPSEQLAKYLKEVTADSCGASECSSPAVDRLA